MIGGRRQCGARLETGQMDLRRNDRGMTLIELMIVVVVVAILASIALPSYRQYVLRSHRVEAKSALLNVAAAQEKFYLQNNTYTENISDAPPDGLGITDFDADTDGVQTENGWYTISIDEGADAETFTVRAVAIGDQEADTDCAAYSLNATGLKTATKDKCWD